MKQSARTTRAVTQAYMPRRRKISGNERGAVAVEFVLILPFFLLLLYAVIEFGWFFVRFEAATGAANNITQAIIQNPTSISQASEYNAGAGIVGPFNTGSNYICAMSYTTLAAAQAGGCSKGQWTTTAPSGVTQGSGNPYYVAVTVYAQPASLTGMVNEILPNGHGGNITAITRSAVTTVPNIATSDGLPTGCSAGQVVTSNGSGGFTCTTSTSCGPGQYLDGLDACQSIPTCTASQFLTYMGGTLNCVTSSGAGSVGGGCTPTGTAQGQTLTCWGDASPVNPNCPTGYTVQYSSGDFSYLCIKN